MRAFESYIKGSLETAAQKAETELKTTLEALPQSPNESELKTAAQAAGLTEDITSQFLDAWSQLKTHIETFTQNKFSPDYPQLDARCVTSVSELSTLIGTITSQITQLEADVQNFDKAAIIKEGSELAARKWCSDRKSVV